MYFASPTWAKYLQNLTPKFKILNVFWTWSVLKENTHQFDCFNWLSIFKNLVILNGSKNVQNVIQITLKKLFFSKKSPSGGSQTPVCDTFGLN